MKIIDSIEIIEVADTKENNDILDTEINSLGYLPGVTYREILNLPYVILLHKKSYYRTISLILKKLFEKGLIFTIPNNTQHDFLGVKVKQSYYEVDVDNVTKVEFPQYYKKTIADLIKRQSNTVINAKSLAHNPRLNGFYEVLNDIQDEKVGAFLIYELDLLTLEFVLRVLGIDDKSEYYKSIIKKSKLVHNK